MIYLGLGSFYIYDEKLNMKKKHTSNNVEIQASPSCESNRRNVKNVCREIEEWRQLMDLQNLANQRTFF